MSDEERAKKVMVRRGQRGAVTRKMTEVDTLLKEAEPDLVKLGQIRETLQDKLGTLKELDKEVQALTNTEAELVDEICKADQTREEIGIVLHKLTVLIDGTRTAPARDSPMDRSRTHGLEPAASTGTTTDSTEITTDSTGITTGDTSRVSPTLESSPSDTPTAKVPVKLPELKLKAFDGNLLQWTSFWDTYESTIHSNKGIPEIQKFTYLKSLLERPASEAIAGLALTSANYTQAIALLQRRYGNKEKIVNRHMELLVALEGATDNKLVTLRKLYDKIEGHLRSLQALKVTTESYSSLLCPILVKKLPQEMKLTISRKLPAEEWNVDSIMKTVLEELEARERMEGIGRGEDTQRGGKGGLPTGAALFTTNNPKYCCYCKSAGHKPQFCRRIIGVSQRKKILRQTGKCYVCLRSGHIGNNCRSNMACTRCKGDHHVSICTKDGNTTEEDGDKASEHTSLNPRAPSFTRRTSTNLYTGQGSQSVLLQTAQVTLINRRLSREVTTNLIFDSGSQRTYVTRRLVKSLKLKILGKQPVTILTFGAKEGKSQQYDVVQAEILTLNSSIVRVKALVVPIICEALRRPSVDLNSYPHLSSLNLADTENSRHIELDVLVGSDYYWHFMSGEVITTSQGPTAVNTTLGWVLSGPVNAERDQGAYSTFVTHVLKVQADPGIKMLDRKLQSFWETEAIGIFDTEGHVYDQFMEHISFTNDGRYEVSLPWREPYSTIPDNYSLCMRRLRSLLNRLRQDKDMFNAYDVVNSWTRAL